MNALFESAIRNAVPETVGKPLSFLKYNTAGSPLRNSPKILFFCFVGDSEMPSYCIKTARAARDNPVIERGYANLQALNHHADAAKIPMLFPRPIALGEIEGVAYSIESAAPGARPRRSELPLVLHAYREFLRGVLHLRQEVPKLQYGNDLIAALDIDESSREELLAYWTHIAGESQMRTVVLVPQHGDFTEDNVLVERGEIAIVDCDQYQESGLAGFDTYYFLKRSARSKEAFEREMRASLRMFAADGDFDVSDLLLWYLTEKIQKQEDLRGTGKKISCSVAEFKELAQKLADI